MKKFLPVLIALFVSNALMAQIKVQTKSTTHITVAPIPRVDSSTSKVVKMCPCGHKCRLLIVNDSHCLLCSTNRWITGYVSISGKEVQYYDYRGLSIDTTKILVLICSTRAHRGGSINTLSLP